MPTRISPTGVNCGNPSMPAQVCCIHGTEIRPISWKHPFQTSCLIKIQLLIVPEFWQFSGIRSQPIISHPPVRSLLNSPAADYLKEKGVLTNDFNTYGSRRGNHEVMKRGTFANIRIKNLMLPGVEGSFTTHQPDGKKMTIFDAAMQISAGRD